MCFRRCWTAPGKGREEKMKENDRKEKVAFNKSNSKHLRAGGPRSDHPRSLSWPPRPGRPLGPTRFNATLQWGCQLGMKWIKKKKERKERLFITLWLRQSKRSHSCVEGKVQLHSFPANSPKQPRDIIFFIICDF